MYLAMYPLHQVNRTITLFLNALETMDTKKFVNDNNLSNLERLEILEKLWLPEPSFNFPQSGKRNLRFQYKWLTQFSGRRHLL